MFVIIVNTILHIKNKIIKTLFIYLILLLSIIVLFSYICLYNLLIYTHIKARNNIHLYIC